MKKLLSLVAAATILAGCHTIPNETTVAALAKSTGIAAGYACQLADIDPEVKDAIVEITTIVQNTIPEGDVSCYDVWKPIIDAELDRLQKAGKLNEVQKAVASSILTLAAEGVDFMFTKHPEWKKYANIVAVAIKSFCDGFIQVMAPLKLQAAGNVDQDTYMYLKMRFDIIKQSK